MFQESSKGRNTSRERFLFCLLNLPSPFFLLLCFPQKFLFVVQPKGSPPPCLLFQIYHPSFNSLPHGSSCNFLPERKRGCKVVTPPLKELVQSWAAIFLYNLQGCRNCLAFNQECLFAKPQEGWNFFSNFIFLYHISGFERFVLFREVFEREQKWKNYDVPLVFEDGTERLVNFPSKPDY